MNKKSGHDIAYTIVIHKNIQLCDGYKSKIQNTNSSGYLEQQLSGYLQDTTF